MMLLKGLISSWMEHLIPNVDLGTMSKSLCIISFHNKHEITTEEPETGMSEEPIEVICRILATKPWTNEVEN